jgi:hypothetical protein
MANKFIAAVMGDSGKCSCKVYYDSESEEYTVKSFRNNVLVADADYFTDDRQDAMGTACVMVDQMDARYAAV